MILTILLVILASIVIIYRLVTLRKCDSLGCLLGKTAIVTGGNSGLGFATCLLLASRGCRIIIADRDNADKSVKEIIKKTGNPNISYKFLDLSSLKNVREFVKEIEKTEEKIDILINNAGVGVAPTVQTDDGLNSVMQINYFGSFLLTHLLLKLLKASSDARVVFTGSLLIFFYTPKLEELNSIDYSVNNFEGVRKAYPFSKLCNVLAAQEFTKKLKNSSITFNSIDPGSVKTQILQKSYAAHSILSLKLLFDIIDLLLGREALIAAQTTLDIATNEKFKNQSGGHYFSLLPWIKPNILKDQEFCDKVWEMSEKLVKLEQEEKIH